MVLLARSPAAKPEKVLIGVAHASREELARLQQELDKRKPRSVGLELREDYETSFSRIGFFGDLYDYLKRSGVSTVLLESPQLWDEYKSAELIKMMHEGAVTLAQLESELAGIAARFKDLRYLAPEMAIPLDNAKRRLERAIVINAEYPTQDALISFWIQLIARRSEYFVRKILETMPDVVIVGLGHAVQMEARLGGYTLEKFSGELPSEIPQTTDDRGNLL